MNLKNNIFYTHHGVCAKDLVAKELVVESAHTRVKETVFIKELYIHQIVKNMFTYKVIEMK